MSHADNMPRPPVSREPVSRMQEESARGGGDVVQATKHAEGEYRALPARAAHAFLTRMDLP